MYVNVRNASLVATAAPSVATAWLSTNDTAIIDPGDLYIESESTVYLEPGDDPQMSLSESLALALGTYYIKVQVDVLGEVDEVDERSEGIEGLAHGVYGGSILQF